MRRISQLEPPDPMPKHLRQFDPESWGGGLSDALHSWRAARHMWMDTHAGKVDGLQAIRQDRAARQWVAEMLRREAGNGDDTKA